VRKAAAGDRPAPRSQLRAGDLGRLVHRVRRPSDWRSLGRLPLESHLLWTSPDLPMLPSARLDNFSARALCGLCIIGGLGRRSCEVSAPGRRTPTLQPSLHRRSSVWSRLGPAHRRGLPVLHVPAGWTPVDTARSDALGDLHGVGMAPEEAIRHLDRGRTSCRPVRHGCRSRAHARMGRPFMRCRAFPHRERGPCGTQRSLDLGEAGPRTISGSPSTAGREFRSRLRGRVPSRCRRRATGGLGIGRQPSHSDWTPPLVPVLVREPPLGRGGGREASRPASELVVVDAVEHSAV